MRRRGVARGRVWFGVLVWPALALPLAQAEPIHYPTLAQLQDWHASAGRQKSAGDSGIRARALRESALRVGAQGALALELTFYNERLRAMEPQLTQIYRFDSLLSEHGRVLPPVIIEARKTAVFEQDKATLTRQVYKIDRPASLVSTPPTWHQYLLAADPQPPQKPPPVLLPRNRREREIWRQEVAEGWKQGAVQAERNIALRIAELHRAFVGRVRYRLLVLRGLIEPATIARSSRPVGGDANELRVGEEIIRITRAARLVKNSRRWKLLPQLPNAFTREFGDGF